MKIKQDIIQIGHKFQIIHTEYSLLVVLDQEKQNVLLNLINNQPDIDKIYLYAKDPYEAKYQYFINKREKVGLDHFNDPTAFMDYSNNMQDVYKNIEEYNPDKERKVLIVFDDMIAEIKERELMSKRLSKYIASFDYFDKSLIVLSKISGRISIASFATVIGIPIGIASASLSLIFSLCTGLVKKLLKALRNKKKKHNKIVMLARSKLNSI